MQNCSSFGFIVRYPEGKESITGHNFEPWHFRYVGRDAAVFMTTNNLTLERVLHFGKWWFRIHSHSNLCHTGS